VTGWRNVGCAARKRIRVRHRINRVRMHAYMYAWMYVRMYICMHVCMYVRMYVLMYVRRERRVRERAREKHTRTHSHTHSLSHTHITRNYYTAALDVDTLMQDDIEAMLQVCMCMLRALPPTNSLFPVTSHTDPRTRARAPCIQRARVLKHAHLSLCMQRTKGYCYTYVYARACNTPQRCVTSVIYV